jgi:molybdopterin converting factor subunit 1
MIVRVKLFAIAKERAGQDELDIELPIGSTLADLRKAIENSSPELAGILPHAMWAVNAQYANEKTILSAQSEIAIIPPVSGG